MFACKVPLFSSKLQGNGDGTLAFQKTNNRGHRKLGGNLYAHMGMIQHQLSLQNTAFFLTGQLMEDGAKLLADLAKNLFPTPLWDKQNMILPIRFRMQQALIRLDIRHKVS